MKRLLGGMIVLIVASAALFAVVWSPNAVDAPAVQATWQLGRPPINTYITFPNIYDRFQLWGGGSLGVFVHRAGDAEMQPIDDTFWGHVRVDLLQIPYTDFEFEVFEHRNGHWVPTNWITIFPHKKQFSIGGHESIGT